MTYKAAIIGCHGVGKTTLANKLKEHGFKLYNEAPINEFQGKNHFLAEIRILTDNILINKTVNENNGYKGISDRFGFLDPLIYGEALRRMEWISEEQLKNIYDLVNYSEHEWVYPEKLICMHDDEEVIINNIKKRGRTGLNEEDNEYLKVVRGLYYKFYNDELEFKYLKPELKKRLYSVPKKVVKCKTGLEDVLRILT